MLAGIRDATLSSSLTAWESPFPGKWTAADERRLPKLTCTGDRRQPNRRSCPVGRQTRSDPILSRLPVLSGETVQTGDKEIARARL